MAQSVGEQLKQMRLARGLTLDQVAQATHIRRHYLEALERDDRDSLPSPVQGRGFLRLYAGHLDLPVETLVAQWEGRPLPEPDAPAAAEPSPAEPSTVPAAEDAPAGPPPVLDALPEAEAAAQVETPVERVEAPGEVAAAEGPVEEEEPPQSPPRSPNGSKEIFKEIGQVLHKQREALSLSIPDVERYTRLRQHYLRAMESGRLDELPSLVQGRGMLSNYATFLNLDADEVLLQYAEGLQQRRLEHLPAAGSNAPAGQRPQRAARQVSGIRRLLTPDLLIGASLILVLFIFVIWTAARVNTIRGEDPQATLPSVGEVLLETNTATQDLTALAQIVLTGTPAEGETEATATPTLPAVVGGETAAPSPTLAAINSDPLQVYIVARQRAFLRVVIDGQIKFNARVVPGNAYPFSGTESIELVSGNAAALQIFFNQADLGSLGAEGDVLRITFTQGGVVTPTPLPTATITPTVGVTITPGPSPTVVTPTVTPLIP